MTDLSAVRDWLDRYIAAWRTYDPEAIGSLFTDDATYRYRPFDEPVRSRQAIVASWLEEPDDPVTWQIECEPLAVNGDLAVARCLTTYGPPGEEPVDRYSNIWVIRLTDDGRASDFTEWWMQPRRTEAG